VATKRPEARYRDILGACAAIAQYLEGCDEKTWRAERMRRDAVERQLLVIGEAATKLGAQAEKDIPHQPWPQIRGLANRLRHEYDGVDSGLIWRLVAGDQLVSLRDAVAAYLARLESGITGD
jgi:uncharacterized protein with HEPN domain